MSTTEFPPDAAARAAQLSADPKAATAADVEGLPDALALLVLEASVRTHEPALATALTGSARKSLAKAAKRALYQLKSQGVVIAEPASTASPPPKAAPEALPALLSAVTGNGERALILARPVRGGVEMVQVVFTDEHGIVQLEAHDVTRAGFRAAIRDSAGRAIEVSAAEGRALLADAAAQSLDARTPYPPGTEEVLRHFDATPARTSLEVPPPVAEDARRLPLGSRLHDEPEVQAWLPPVDALRTLALKADEIATSQLYLNDAQRDEQLRHQTQAAAEAFFTPSMKALYARRLWRMADYFERTARSDAAALARGSARVLAHPGGEPLPAFCARLFEKVIELTRQLQRGEAPPQAPDPEAPHPPTEKRSPGGLILP